MSATEKNIQVFMCGNKIDHDCNDIGPMIYGLSDGTTTVEKPLFGKGCVWGSVSCSICGMSAMDRDMWRDLP